MTNEPKVAVAVPVHNGALHLRQCLECLAIQDTPHMSVLVFENASSDGSSEIAREFCERDSRFSFHPSDRLLGMWSNFSRAIQVASETGDFFMIRAHDDLSSTNYVSALRETLCNNTDASLAVPKVERIFDDCIRKLSFQPELLDLRNLSSIRKIKRKIKLPASWFYGMYRSETAASIFLSALQDFPHPWGGDRYILMQFLLRGQIIFDPRATFQCRMGSGNEQVYLKSSVAQNLNIRATYTAGTFRALFQSDKLNFLEKLSLFGRVLASAPVHTHTSFRQIIQRKFAD